jgi:hypothetical protein
MAAAEGYQAPERRRHMSIRFFPVSLVRKVLLFALAFSGLSLVGLAAPQAQAGTMGPIRQAAAAGCAAEISVSTPHVGQVQLQRGSTTTFNHPGVDVYQVTGPVGPAKLSASLQLDPSQYQGPTGPLPPGLSVTFKPNPMMTSDNLTGNPRAAMTIALATSAKQGEYYVQIGAVQGCATTSTYIIVDIL